MIKEQITASINSYDFNGEIIVPSQVMTATPQEEDMNLAYSPNFQLKLDDSYSYLTVTDTVEVTFDTTYESVTAYCNVINRNGKMVTLQYNDGLIVTEIDDSSDDGSSDVDPEP